MDLDAFRGALIERQREAVRSARARMGGEAGDERLLDELDACLFSPDRTRTLADDLAAAPSRPMWLSARSRLALSLRWGPLSRLRSLDRALSHALRTGLEKEARAIVDQMDAVIAREGSGVESVPLDATLAEHDGEAAPERNVKHRDYLALSGLTRGVDLSWLQAEARSILEGSVEGCFEELIAGQRDAGPPGLVRPGAGRDVDSETPHATTDGALLRLRSVKGAPRSFEACLSLLLDNVERAGDLPDSSSILRAVLELADDLGMRGRVPPVIRVEALDPAPVVLEVDPPGSVELILPQGAGPAALAQALDATGRALEASLRSATLPAEHRLHSDRAVGFAMGALFASLAGEYAPRRGARGVGLRRALRREILETRLAASLFLARASLLRGVSATSSASAAQEAALRPVPVFLVPFEEEALLDCADRLRGHMLVAGLRERLRTRFGNLWYRERAAGRLLEEICEPGGSIVASEIVTGLSLPAPHAESLLASWREECRRVA